MTKEELSPLAAVLLDTLRAAGGVWLTRLEIAQRIGRPAKMQPRDIDTLQELADRGLIEVSHRIRGVAQTEYIYRAAPN